MIFLSRARQHTHTHTHTHTAHNQRRELTDSSASEASAVVFRPRNIGVFACACVCALERKRERVGGSVCAFLCARAGTFHYVQHRADSDALLAVDMLYHLLTCWRIIPPASRPRGHTIRHALLWRQGVFIVIRMQKCRKIMIY
jgi:hypothetical protein